MSLVRWTPFIEPFEEFDRFVEAEHAKGFAPALNMYETNDSIVVEASLAGVDPKDVDISIENGVLTIKGQTKHESEVDEKSYYRKEVRAGSFFRTMPLPSPVVADEANAESHEGMLKITIPKAPEARPKSIKINIKK